MIFERSGVFLSESFDIRQDMLCYWREAGGSSLTQSFMAIAEQRHKVPKLSKGVLPVFVEKQGGIMCFFLIKRPFVRIKWYFCWQNS